MKGYPKHLNTKSDYIFVKNNFPKNQWAKDWQTLLDSRQDWFFVKALPDKASGVEDATHKIVETQSGESEKVTYSQYELREDKNAKIYRLGFTIAEVETALA